MGSPGASPGAEKNAKRKYEEHDQSDRNGATTAEDTGKRSRTIGPSLPPQLAEKSASEGGSDSESSDDSDDIGPSMPPGGAQSGSAGPSRDTDEVAGTRSNEQQASPPVSVQNQRDEWMLAPPDQGDWTSRVDPTKLRNRKFNTGRSARGAPSSQDSATPWTETPEQKRKRLENEVMGIQQPASGGASREPSGNKTASDKLMEKRLQSYSDKSQRKALYKEHQETANAAKEQDDPSARPFDREKDIAGPGTISSAKRREIINKSSDYTSRFSRGKFL